MHTIRVTTLGEYIRYNSCERRFKLNIDKNLSEQIPFWTRLQNPLDVILQENGKGKEREWMNALRAANFTALPCDGMSKHGTAITSWDYFLQQVQNLKQGQNAFAEEVIIDGKINDFYLYGQIDFLLIYWEEDRPVFRIVECKASRKEATYQRIQIAAYKLLVQQLLQRLKIQIDGVMYDNLALEGVIARLDAHSSRIQNISDLKALDLSREVADIQQLLQEEGKLKTIIHSDLDELPFQLQHKCDSCLFNIHCLSESSRQRRIELLSLNSGVVRALTDVGIYNLDQLAEMDDKGAMAKALRNNSGFNTRLDTLIARAKARIKKLPPVNLDKTDDKTLKQETFEVTPLDNKIKSQLPEYVQKKHRLIRIYLHVSYDYTENRIVALAAHVTKSQHRLHTEVNYNSKPPQFEPYLQERNKEGEVVHEEPQGKFILRMVANEWTNKFEIDNAREEQVLADFFKEIGAAIKRVAKVGKIGHAPVHFYVWSRQEMKYLIEACSRSTDSRPLNHFKQLLGCREKTEQLIYSCVQDEVYRKYALGWTGHGLTVASSLHWFGTTYHWHRDVDGEEVDLSKIFMQDLFDFKTDLWLTPDRLWATVPHANKLSREEQFHRHTQLGHQAYSFEIRSRFSDSIPAPYFYAYWDSAKLRGKRKLNPRESAIIKRYENAADYLEAFIEARTYAVRWMEERMTFKNYQIIKPPLKIAEITKFKLEVNNIASAAKDFIQLDHHIKLTDWISAHFKPPIDRISEGLSLPLKNVHWDAKSKRLTAQINVTDYDTDLDSLLGKCSYTVGDFARVTECSPSPEEGQNLYAMRSGKTCLIESIEEDSGHICLSIIPFFKGKDDYILPSFQPKTTGILYRYATLDDSASEFTYGKVERQLDKMPDAPAYDWLNTSITDITIPPQRSFPKLAALEEFLTVQPLSSGFPLESKQRQAVLEGINAKIQLMQGPPGTGKTTTASIAILLRILAHISGSKQLVLVAANTHLAVNTLLQKIDEELPTLRQGLQQAGFSLPNVQLIKLHSSSINAENSPAGNVIDMTAKCSKTKLGVMMENQVLVVGGTTGSLLKFSDHLHSSRHRKSSISQYKIPMLVIDEASMMVFPHFLCLATLLDTDGQILLAGDHRQLSPIIAGDWEQEDRPPVVLYKPFVSAYQALWDIRKGMNKKVLTIQSLVVSQLTHTFRLPYDIRKLIARLYRLDDLELSGVGKVSSPSVSSNNATNLWTNIWQAEEGLFLVIHNENASKKTNEMEAIIISRIMENAPSLEAGSTAIVTPHRAQRSKLKNCLPQS